MKFLKILTMSAALAAAAAAGWFAARTGHDHGAGAARKVRFYQSPMHPWIKSETPGTCTICGMQLVPVYEGDAAMPEGDNLVTLPAGAVTVTGVATSPVGTGLLRRTLRMAGTIDDDDSRHRILPAYVEGRIEELAVGYVGAEVRAGDPLATFYSPLLLAAVREYAAYRATGAAAGPAGDPAGLGGAAVVRLRQYGLAPDQIEELAARPDPDRFALPLRSPVGGTVVRRLAYPGQWVREGDPLFEIADFDTMWFQFDAYEPDLPWLEVGQQVVVTSPSLPGRALTNRIAFIDPNLDPMTRSTKVRVEIANPSEDTPAGPRRLIRHRTYGEARVVVGVPGVLLVPRSAVLSPDGHPVAWVESAPGAYERRELRLGRRGDDAWEVLGGVEAGERVVTQGGLLIDAQAQLQGGPTGGHAHGATPVAGTPGAAPGPVTLPADPLDASARQALETFLGAVERARSALAADDPAGYESARAGVAESAGALRAAVAGSPGWTAALHPVLESAALPAAPGLREARAAFHRITAPLVPLLVELRRAGATPSTLRIYQCPMTRKAFDGAPSKAAWFQLSGGIANPWFGAAMPDCGTEMKP